MNFISTMITGTGKELDVFGCYKLFTNFESSIWIILSLCPLAWLGKEVGTNFETTYVRRSSMILVLAGLILGLICLIHSPCMHKFGSGKDWDCSLYYIFELLINNFEYCAVGCIKLLIGLISIRINYRFKLRTNLEKIYSTASFSPG